MAHDPTKAVLFLFKNRFKDSATKPVHTGPGKITRACMAALTEAFQRTEGEEVELECASWVKQDKNGADYYSVQFGVPDPKYKKDTQPPPAGPDEGDDIPF